MPFNTTGQPTPQSLTPDPLLLGTVLAGGSLGLSAAFLASQPPIGQSTPQSSLRDIRFYTLTLADSTRGTPITLTLATLPTRGRATPQSLVIDSRLANVPGWGMPDDSRATPLALLPEVFPPGLGTPPWLLADARLNFTINPDTSQRVPAPLQGFQAIPIGQPTPQSLFLDPRQTNVPGLGIPDTSQRVPAALQGPQTPPIGQPTLPSLFQDLRAGLVPGWGIPDDSRATPNPLLAIPPLTPGNETPPSLVLDQRLNFTINPDTSRGSPPILLGVFAIREAGAMADSLSVSLTTTIAEAGAGADTVTGGFTVGASLVEGTGLTDDFEAALNMAIVEAGAGADTITAFTQAVGTLVEAGAAVETVSGQLVATGTLVEFDAAVDGLTGGFVLLGTITEQIAPIGQDFDEPFDVVNVTLTASGSLAEAGALADTQSWSFVGIGTISEAGALADTNSVVFAAVTSIAEAMAARDTLSVGQSLNVSIAEAMAALETVFGEAFTNLSITEQGALADAVTVLAVQFQYGNGLFWQLPGPPPFR
jgi:hypothetical protein